MATYSFVFVISSSVFPAILYITQFLIHTNSRWILQLIKGISNNCQKLLRYFIEAGIFVLFNTPLLLTGTSFPKMLDLYLSNGELKFSVISALVTALVTIIAIISQIAMFSEVSICSLLCGLHIL